LRIVGEEAVSVGHRHRPESVSRRSMVVGSRICLIEQLGMGIVRVLNRVVVERT
jgi:hypothetical protein